MVFRRRQELVRLTEAAMAVALSVLLGNVRLVELPHGGSIALATLPLLALALTRGVRPALLACCCAGAAHALSGGTIVHPAQLALDYLLAYAALAVAGIGMRGAGGGRARIVLPVVAAMALHLGAMVLSGIVFFAPVAGTAALAYSITYNAATVVPETLLAIWLLPPLVRALARADPADAWRRGLLDPPRMLPRRPRPIRAPQPIDTPHVTRPHVSAAPPRSMPEAPAVTTARSPRQATLVRQAPFVRRPWDGVRSIAPAKPDDRVER